LAIDNDPQHNLTDMLGVRIDTPTIRDVYHENVGAAARQLAKAVRKTSIDNLSVVPSTNELCVHDVRDSAILQKCFAFCALERAYDFVLIDNSPGIDILQEASIHASQEAFVPTELSQFALNGIGELDKLMSRRFPGGCRITKIIPNFYRTTKIHDLYIREFLERFPGRITATAIPFDSTFDTLVKERKVLFLHRLSSRAAAFYLKLVHELFELDEQKTWEMVMKKRQERLSFEARQRLLENRPDGRRRFPAKLLQPQAALVRDAEPGEAPAAAEKATVEPAQAESTPDAPVCIGQPAAETEAVS
jgi:cellulose biosynthesis protein BcsQ